MPAELLSAGVLEQSDDIAVFILDGGDQPASANILDLLKCLSSSVHEVLQTFPDVLNMIVGSRSLLMAVGSRPISWLPTLKPT